MKEEKIADLVHNYYWKQDINCARTCLLTLGNLFHHQIHPQTYQAAIGMHGAGGFRAQCGLVEGSLMFLGSFFGDKGYTENDIVSICYGFAKAFEEQFFSLSCYDLRPNGFTKQDEPHLCERLTVRAIHFTEDFILQILGTD